MKATLKPKPKSPQRIYEELWLNYFNSVLLEKNLISAEENRRLKLQIKVRSDHK